MRRSMMTCSSRTSYFFTLDLIKERLTLAYSRDNEGEMANDIEEIMDICAAADNEHLTWFGKLLSTHFEGIIAHATYKISSGRIEGIKQQNQNFTEAGLWTS